MIWGSNPGRSKRFFSNPKLPDLLCCPLSCLHSGYRGSFLAVKQPGQKLTIQLYPVVRLRINVIIPQVPLCIFIMWTGKILPLSGSKVGSCEYETRNVGYCTYFV
jgi:hypothetical protein